MIIPFWKRTKVQTTNNIETINDNNELLNYIEELQTLDEKLKKKAELTHTYTKRIETLFKTQKKLFKNKEKLGKMKEPILFLERNSGEIEIYSNVKGTEFMVPNLPAGIEKKIYLTTQHQEEIPYAGQTFKAYRCHEEYAFPHKWGKPQLYTGKYKEQIKNWLTQNQLDREEGIPIILETANVNSEVMRDRERKMLIAWEKFKANANSESIKAWGKLILWGLLGTAAVVLAWKFMDKQTAKEVGTIVVQNTTQAGGVLIG